ncbi:heterokaryon incompatibility protein-domain-containing protein [Cladorrhinum sp. PSN259]|nr:heterokaryon incompatibility protein-domain-containing protein [Cladorrhinum sp. PSN259]
MRSSTYLARALLFVGLPMASPTPGVELEEQSTPSGSEWVSVKPNIEVCRDVKGAKPRPIRDCNCLIEVRWDDWADGSPNCESIAEYAGITVDQIRAWNPWIKEDCGQRGDTIRVVTILPGNFGDEIRVKISHVSLAVFGCPPLREKLKDSPRLGLDEIRATLPPGWKVIETWDHRYLFIFTSPGDDGPILTTSWKHPDDMIEPSLYEPPSSSEPATSGQCYEALSYTWGPEGHGEFIYLSEPASRISVRANLASGLRHLRYTDKERIMWIDALCINQTDVQERNTQVGRMSHIYQLAKRVVVWVGPATEDSTAAMEFMGYIGSQIAVDLAGGKEVFLPAPDAQEKDLWDKTQEVLESSPSKTKAAALLLERDWFSRMWVLQEVCLAQQVNLLCGRDELDWPDFANAVMAQVGYVASATEEVSAEPHKQAALNAMELVTNRAEMQCDYCFPVDVYDLAAGRLCSDPRDHVYGLLGMLPDGLRSRLPLPDYDLPASRVYHEFTIAAIRHRQRLGSLETCCLDTSMPDLPSWVPNFSNLPRGSPSPGQFSAGFSRCWASFSSDEPPSKMKVTGVRCAVIQRTTPSIPADVEKAVQIIQDFLPATRDLDSAPPYVNGESLRSAYIKSLWFESDAVERDPGLFNTLMGQPDPTRVLIHLILLMNFARDKRYMMTKDGYLGLGPPKAEPGDIVCILLGCEHGVVLRPSADSDQGDEFLVVGPCYVYGLHLAIPLLGPFPEPWTVIRKFGFEGGYRFYNKDTKAFSDDDPRLPPLEGNWEHAHRKSTDEDPQFFQCFRNKITGEEIVWDPRMVPEALKARGVKLEEFTLV